MNKITRIWIGLWLAGSLSGCFSAPGPAPERTAAQGALILAAKLDKAVYALNEPITVSVTLTNPGPQPRLVQGRLLLNRETAPGDYWDIAFIIQRSGGEAVPFEPLIDVGEARDSDFVTLAPGESLEQAYPLLPAFALQRTGEYTLTAIYHNQHDPGSGQRAWQGELKADAVPFSLTP